jgi:hypothetical protein
VVHSCSEEGGTECLSSRRYQIDTHLSRGRVTIVHVFPGHSLFILPLRPHSRSYPYPTSLPGLAGTGRVMEEYAGKVERAAAKLNRDVQAM